MRTIRHPITMFVTAILVVIGIGVGVVAATTSQKVYGPSWGRFSVAFPGRVNQYPGHLTVTFASGSSDSSPFRSTMTLRFTDFTYSNDYSGWVGYAPMPGVLAQSDLRVSVEPGIAVRMVVGSVRKAFPGVLEDQQHADGFSVVTFGPRCESGLCSAAEVVSNGRVLWYLLAFSSRPAIAVQGFLDSFQPIG